MSQAAPGDSKSTLPHIPNLKEEASPYLDHVKNGTQQESRPQQDQQSHLPRMRSTSSLASQKKDHALKANLQDNIDNPF